MSAGTLASQDQVRSKKSALLLAIGFFVTTLATPGALGRNPLANYLKNGLHLSQSQNATFFFIVTLPFYFKPIAGLLTDAFPIFGKRRFHYMWLSAAASTGFWLLLSAAEKTYANLLSIGIAINVCMVFCSTVFGAFLIDSAKAVGGSGRLSSLRQGVMQVCYLLNGDVAGRLAKLPLAITGYVCGGLALCAVPATPLLLEEEDTSVDRRKIFAEAGKQLRTVFRSSLLWAVSGIMLLFYAAPGLQSALYYKQQNVLHLDTVQQGDLMVLSGAAGIIASLVYVAFCRKLDFRPLLLLGLVAGVVANGIYLFYNTPESARLIEAANGFGFTLAELVLLDLAIRATPTGSEGLGFAIIQSARAAAILGTDVLGSMLMDRFHFSFSSLVLSNAATTALAIPCCLLLPRTLLARKEEVAMA